MRKKRCPKNDCPHLIPATARYCPSHMSEWERRRGTSSERGYNALHHRLRAELAPVVAAGSQVCARCGAPIAPHEPWHLDHDEARQGYLGASHAFCNLSAAGKQRAKNAQTPGGST